jgi:fatty acyl-CoA reductase
MYEKMHKFSYVISPFCTNEWVFTNNNVRSLWQRLNSQDKLMFRFSMDNFDWNQYLDDYVKGIRIYLLKDDIKTLEASKIKWRRYNIYNEYKYSKFL